MHSLLLLLLLLNHKYAYDNTDSNDASTAINAANVDDIYQDDNDIKDRNNDIDNAYEDIMKVITPITIKILTLQTEKGQHDDSSKLKCILNSILLFIDTMFQEILQNILNYVYIYILTRISVPLKTNITKR